MSCKSVLVVDDDEDIRSNILLALQAEGHTVLEAANGEEALHLLLGLEEDHLPGCILLDLMMPKMDGVTFLKMIHQGEHRLRFARIPVVVATAKGGPIEAIEVPTAVERIQKPFELDELYRVVERHCGKPD